MLLLRWFSLVLLGAFFSFSFLFSNIGRRSKQSGVYDDMNKTDLRRRLGFKRLKKVDSIKIEI